MTKLLQFQHSSIKGISCTVPKLKYENEHCSLFNDTEEYQRFLEATGIATRYIVGDSGVCTSDLCFDAAKRLLNELQWEPESIDCLLFVTQTPDYILPATACILQERLGLPKSTYAMDIGLGCSGWVYGLSVAQALLESGVFKRTLLLAGDTTSVTKSPLDRSTFPLFGDAGTATALEFSEGNHRTVYHFGTDGSGYEAIMIKDGGFRNPVSYDSFKVELKSDDKTRNDLQSILNGAEVFTFGISQAPKSVKELLSALEISSEKIYKYFFHQANVMMNERIRQKLKLTEDQVPYSIQDYGNTSSASIPLTMCLHRDKLRSDETYIACGFGVGLSWGSVCFQLEDAKFLEINYI